MRDIVGREIRSTLLGMRGAPGGILYQSFLTMRRTIGPQFFRVRRTVRRVLRPLFH
jgi:hypothetical protein